MSAEDLNQDVVHHVDRCDRSPVEPPHLSSDEAVTDLSRPDDADIAPLEVVAGEKEANDEDSGDDHPVRSVVGDGYPKQADGSETPEAEIAGEPSLFLRSLDADLRVTSIDSQGQLRVRVQRGRPRSGYRDASVDVLPNPLRIDGPCGFGDVL